VESSGKNPPRVSTKERKFKELFAREERAKLVRELEPLRSQAKKKKKSFNVANHKSA
jgi:hypothetical protein